MRWTDLLFPMLYYFGMLIIVSVLGMPRSQDNWL